MLSNAYTTSLLASLLGCIVAASEHLIHASEQLDAAAYVDKYNKAWNAESDCNAFDGKGIFEKYGEQPELQWKLLCGDNADKGSYFKCAGKGNDWMCLGANVGIKDVTDHVQSLAAESGNASNLTGALKPRSREGYNSPKKVMRRVKPHRQTVDLQEDVKLASQSSHTKPKKVAALALSGCSWVADEKDVLFGTNFGNYDRFMPDSEKGECTAPASRKGHYLAMSALDGWNPFEGMHEPLMAFATIAKLGLRPDQVQLLHVRSGKCANCKMGSPWKSFMGALTERVFGRGGTSVELQSQRLCLENVIFPIAGAQSIFSKTPRGNGFDNPQAARCSSSPVLLGFAGYVKDSFAVDQTARGADAKLRITLPLRKPSPEHVGPYRREMKNSDQLRDALNSSVGDIDLVAEEGTSHDADEVSAAAAEAMMEQLASELRSTGEFNVREVIPASMAMEDQVQLFSNTDLLIAPHGASLTWQILQPGCSQVIEFCDGGDFHFVNIAHFMGKKHTCLRGPSGWGAPSFNADVTATLKLVKDIKRQWLTCMKDKR